MLSAVRAAASPQRCSSRSAALSAALRGSTPNVNQRMTAAVRCAGSSSTPSVNQSMPDDQFDFMKRVIGAPSPVGLEASMTQGVLAPEFEAFGACRLGWHEHKFRGNAGTVWDTAGPSATLAAHKPRPLTVMICGHADKIRMQVRSIGEDGKIWINSDSFLPLTLIGNNVTLFSENPALPGSYRCLEATVEALGAIHFAPPEARSGKKGIGPEELYLELGLHGSKRKKQLAELGVRPGVQCRCSHRELVIAVHGPTPLAAMPPVATGPILTNQELMILSMAPHS